MPNRSTNHFIRAFGFILVLALLLGAWSSANAYDMHDRGSIDSFSREIPSGPGSGSFLDTGPDQLQGAREPDSAGLAQQDGIVRIVVELAVAFSPESARGGQQASDQRQRIAAAQSEVVDLLEPSQVLSQRRYRNVPFLALEIRESSIGRLLESPAVAQVHEDRPIPPVLGQSVPLIGADQAWLQGYDGAGQIVAILDTGVDVAHPAFAGRVNQELCYSTTSQLYGSTTVCPNGQEEQIGPGAAEPCSVNGCDHGTHVAGISLGDDATITGVAPGAELIAIQVFSQFTGSICGGTSPCVLSFTSDQMAALDWLYTNRDNLGGVLASSNLSLGGTQTYSSHCDSEPLEPIITSLRAEDISTVIAAGNGGSTTGISAPACISTAISVGSTTKNDTVSFFSNAASIMSLWAPGSSIFSSVPGGYASFSGTSMAAPHVAGVMAILGQHSPGTGVGEKLSALTSSGVMITDTRSGNGVTKPRVQVDAALDVLDPEPTPTPGGPTLTPTPTPTPSPTATSSDRSTPTIEPTSTQGDRHTPTPTNTQPVGPTPTPTFTPTVGPSATPTNTPTTGPTSTPTNTPSSEDGVHIGDLDGSSSPARNGWSASVLVTVHDADHGLVAGAQVTGLWTAGGSWSVTCVTDSQGQCTIHSGPIALEFLDATLEITDAGGRGISYDPSGNHDPDGDSDGTTILIASP